MAMQFMLTAFLCVSLSMIDCARADTTKRIVKWKDENGTTHYGDKIPPQYSNRENSLMNKQGITVQKNNPNVQQDKNAELAKIEQEKKDRALLGTFTNAEEIDLTRDRNLEPDLLALKSLQQDRAVAQKKLEKSSSTALSYTKANKTVPASIRTEVETDKNALAKIDRRISERQLAIDNIRKRFEEDKKRYLTLRGLSGEPQPATPEIKN